ncbi:MAG: M20/M25/M40 family metallo-hydrolase, partial [Clostridia bacterium]|nr:M20/M25/M40 family metallo-hydrolase [Clostridia bacterium]
GYSAQQIKELVEPGDTVTFKNKFVQLKNNIVSTKSQDDRTSVAVLVSVMKKLQNYQAPFDIYFVAGVQEEVGLRGAKTAAYGINPDMAIVIDVCHATTPDSGSGDAYEFGSGAIVTKGPNIHPKMLAKVLEALDDSGIEYQTDIEGGDTGTDAWAVQVCRCGIPTVLFSVPLRYMHTPVETVSCGDLSTLVNSISAFVTYVSDVEECICY